MRKITLEAVPRDAMRPPYDSEESGGDWLVDREGNLVVRVLGDDFARPETFLIALHELAEAALCLSRGISQERVDAFDARFAEWPIADQEAEPGDHPAAPYRVEHRQAMLIEHLMAQFLGLSGYGMVR